MDEKNDISGNKFKPGDEVQSVSDPCRIRGFKTVE